MTHPTRQIPLSALRATATPVRVTPATAAAHDELVASIRAHGLLQDLVVRAADGGTYAVVAGNRRLAALRAIADHGDMAADAPITCAVLENGVGEHEAALAENVVRVAMNRADQVTAFAHLIDAGAAVEEIAVRFGVSANMVERRLRLAHLAPRILDDYRAGRITEAVAQAFATTSDQERQMEAYEWTAGQYYEPHPNAIRSRLESGMARSTGGLALFVGLDAYTAAGGNGEHTLFADYAVLSDVELLMRLAKDKMNGIARSLEGEWKWAEYTVDNGINLMPYTRLHPDTIATATEEESARMSELGDFMDGFEGLDWDDLTDEQRERYAAAEREIEATNRRIAGRAEWSDEQKAASGVLLHINRDGTVGRYEGLVREGDPVPGRDDPPDDDTLLAGDATAGSHEAGAAAPPAEKPKQRGYSQGLRESITELRNAVLRDALAGAPDVAGDLLTFNLLLGFKTGYDEADLDSGGFSPDLPLSIRRETPQRLPVQGASAAMRGYLEAPKLELPWFDKRKPVGVLFEAYRRLDCDTKGRLTAAVVARLMYSVAGGDRSAYDCHAAVENELQPAYASELLNVCADTCWSEETIWNRLRKDQIIAECRPCLGDQWAREAGSMKKKALAEDAATRMREHPDWLPKGFHAAARPAAADAAVG